MDHEAILAQGSLLGRILYADGYKVEETEPDSGGGGALSSPQPESLHSQTSSVAGDVAELKQQRLGWGSAGAGAGLVRGWAGREPRSRVESSVTTPVHHRPGQLQYKYTHCSNTAPFPATPQHSLHAWHGDCPGTGAMRSSYLRTSSASSASRSVKRLKILLKY